MSGSFLFQCSQCGEHLQVQNEHFGQEVTCPKCGQVITATLPQAATQPSRRPGAVKRGFQIAGLVVLAVVVMLYMLGRHLESSVNHESVDAIANSGIDSLPPITIGLRDDLLKALKMTDELDLIFKRGGSSAEFYAAGAPAEAAAMELLPQLPKGDPRRQLLAGTFEEYQQVGAAMKNEKSSEEQNVFFVTAGVRKAMLTKVLEGHMTDAEKKLFHTIFDSATP